MKKAILTTCLTVIMVTGTKAQYFQKLYSDNSSADNGMITRSTGPGHVMAGVNRLDLTIDFGLMVVRTDPDGSFMNPTDFNNTYMLQTANGDILRFTAGHVVEFLDGTGYGVMGSFLWDDPTATFAVQYGLAYIRLDLTGNVMAVNGYMPGFNTYSLTLASICESSVSPGDIFATAHWDVGGENASILALRISQNGTLLWGNIYDLSHATCAVYETPHDIIESPYGNNEVIIVGTITVFDVSNYQAGWYLRLDQNTGGALMAQTFPGNEFFAISVSNDPAASGFILCGHETLAGTDICCVTKTDQNLNVQWSYLYTNNWKDNMLGYDVVGRLNTLGNYEYYITGRMHWTHCDAIVIKINDLGIPANPGALFVYSTSPLVAQWGNRIDVNTSGSGDGVSIYGVWDDPYNPPLTRRTYLIKAYFNGESGCHQSFVDISEHPNQVLLSPIGVLMAPISTLQLNLMGIHPDNNMTLCHSSSIPGGDNTVPASLDDTKTGSAVRLFPNPVNTGKDPMLHLELPDFEGPLQLIIYDALGREVFRKTYPNAGGGNTLQVEIGKLEKGIYQVMIEKVSGTETLKFIIQ